MYYNQSKGVKEQLINYYRPTKEQILLAEAIDALNKRLDRPPDNMPEALKVLEGRSKKPNIIA